MINGAHVILYSKKPEADRAFMRDVLKLTNVDVGGGWLIFGLPPAELAVHPAGKNDLHELYLMCSDIREFVEQMKKHDIKCGAVNDQGWGLLSELHLPGGGKLGVYEPRHERPAMMIANEKSAKPVKSSKKKPLKNKSGKPRRASNGK